MLDKTGRLPVGFPQQIEYCIASRQNDWHK